MACRASKRSSVAVVGMKVLQRCERDAAWVGVDVLLRWDGMLQGWDRGVTGVDVLQEWGWGYCRIVLQFN